MKTLITVVCCIVLVVVLQDVALAQPGMPGAPQQSPIDGGLGLLALAGGAYALKKMRGRSQ